MSKKNGHALAPAGETHVVLDDSDDEGNSNTHPSFIPQMDDDDGDHIAPAQTTAETVVQGASRCPRIVGGVILCILVLLLGSVILLAVFKPEVIQQVVYGAPSSPAQNQRVYLSGNATILTAAQALAVSALGLPVGFFNASLALTGAAAATVCFTGAAASSVMPLLNFSAVVATYQFAGAVLTGGGTSPWVCVNQAPAATLPCCAPLVLTPNATDVVVSMALAPPYISNVVVLNFAL